VTTPNAVPIDRYLRLPGSAKEVAFTLNLELLGASIGIRGCVRTPETGITLAPGGEMVNVRLDGIC
jgi:hypothetical protein